MKTKKELIILLKKYIKEANQEKSENGSTDYYYNLRGVISIMRKMIYDY